MYSIHSSMKHKRLYNIYLLLKRLNSYSNYNLLSCGQHNTVREDNKTNTYRYHMNNGNMQNH